MDPDQNENGKEEHENNTIIPGDALNTEQPNSNLGYGITLEQPLSPSGPLDTDDWSLGDASTSARSSADPSEQPLHTIAQRDLERHPNHSTRNRRLTVMSPMVDPDREDYVVAISDPNILVYTPGSPVSMENSTSPQWVQHGTNMFNDTEPGFLVPSPPAPDFCPQESQYSEWMGRSLETLLIGYGNVAPVLCLPEDEDEGDNAYGWGQTRRRSTCSTLGSKRGSLGGNRRGSLVGGGNMHGGTLANYYNRRRGTNTSSRRGTNDSGNSTQISNSRRNNHAMSRRGSTSHGPTYRRRMSMTRTTNGDAGVGAEAMPSHGGPNICLSLLARETTGRIHTRNSRPAVQRLQDMGGHALFAALDRDAAGICSEVNFLSEIIDSGDWAETQTVIARICPRLMGDPSGNANDQSRPAPHDPNLPPTASRYYAGGGRLGFERSAFVQAGGIEVLMRVFRESSFVGAEMARTYDARDLSVELVANRLASCWNETIASLRELVYAIPSVIETTAILDDGEFIPFLFTLLAHDSCFEGAAALIEELLSLLSHSHTQSQVEVDLALDSTPFIMPSVRIPPPTTFFLGNVPHLYRLWNGFNCRQLAHFCRILTLLIFEPEDRQILESPAVLKSIELLQLRRNRAARAGRDSTVDMNQSIILGDLKLVTRLLALLRVMNFAPDIRHNTAFHVMTHFPFIPDTLIMLGVKEIIDWDDIERWDKLARKLLPKNEATTEAKQSLSSLGSVATMLEKLSDDLNNQYGEQGNNQLYHIIRVVNVADEAGVVHGGSRPGRPYRVETSDGEFHVYTPHDSARRSANDTRSQPAPRPSVGDSQDAANWLQFNALLLGPYQVEILFVLCILLGGRRKIHMQEMCQEYGMIPILEDMFERLPWQSLSAHREVIPHQVQDDEQTVHSSGIHGPGCECTPESALCVQYLRLLHNFCDRDCDNYSERRLLLSQEERNLIFTQPQDHKYTISHLRPGLLSKIMTAFIGESDDSPYRFWLASCVESYLRGSSASEQIFIAQAGLLDHLINEITSQTLHCAGSLQTSFDLLGELCKGNGVVLRMLASKLNEETFKKMMSVAAANLVDSNVFIRSLFLSLERMSAVDGGLPLHLHHEAHPVQKKVWKSQNVVTSKAYLTHSWWDIDSLSLFDDPFLSVDVKNPDLSSESTEPSDWFPNRRLTVRDMQPFHMIDKEKETNMCLHNGVGHFGWVFTPCGSTLCDAAHAPNTVERFSWFLAANQTRLLRDLLDVVDLRTINHENICCLNTAVVITIFAFRRNRLDVLLHELRAMNEEENETKLRALNTSRDNVIDQAFVRAMRHVDEEKETQSAPYARRASLNRRTSQFSSSDVIGDKNDALRNFREVLWFWIEYYSNRGRDRLSVEFSSHLRFEEWMDVVSKLSADNDNASSLVRSPVRLPLSPYQRAARTLFDNRHCAG